MSTVFPLQANAATATPVLAAAASPKVVITEVQTSGHSSSDEFVELYNLTNDPIDFADQGGGGKNAWKLQFFSVAATANGKPDWSKPAATVSLSGVIQADDYYVLSATGYAPGGFDSDQTYGSRLADSGGGLQLVESSAAAQTAHDRIMWQQVNTGTALPDGVLPSPASGSSLQRMPTDDNTYVASDGILSDFQVQTPISPADIWQPPVEEATGQPAPDALSTDPAADEGSTPPGDGTAASSADVPADNTGLAQPLITELLPNPASPLSDTSDEFIEIYNSNYRPFNLKGYTLEVGTSTLHDFTFNSDSILPAQGYEAFYSADTRLSLSNTGSVAKLMDSAQAVVSQTDPYGAAADGESWAYDGSTWQWSTVPTPGAANTIAPPAAALGTVKTAAKATTVKAAAVKAPKSTKTAAKKVSGTTKTKKAAASKVKKAKKSAKAKIATVAHTIAQPEKTPIHTGILVAVAVLAVLYAAYEYRHDILNYIYGLRRNRAVRAHAR